MFFFEKVYKLLKLLKFKLWRKGLLNGIAASIELEKILKNINPETVIDIGSNKGQFVMLIEQLFPNKIIYSFEPILEVLEKQKKFFNYKKNIFFYNFALGSSTLTEDFYITKSADNSSFFKAKKNGNKNKKFEIKEKKNIQIKTLDEVIINEKIIGPVLMKIDVQGYELEVLKGSENMLKKIEYILLEVSETEVYENQPLSDRIITFLQKRNYQILIQNRPKKIEKTNFIQMDILFQKQLSK